MFISIPIDIEKIIIEVPPKLINGKVIPVVGNNPNPTATCINALVTIVNERPNASN
jgi:hypothetical protein